MQFIVFLYQSDLENNPGINTKTTQRLNSKEPIQQ